MSAALRMTGVEKSYGRVRALRGLDLEVPRGSVTGLVGPNGAGKTTAFSVVGGLVRPDKGEVDILGEGPFQAARHAGRVALLPQDASVQAHNTVRQLLTFFARLQGMGARQATRQVDRVLESVALREKTHAPVRTLSHGLRRRLEVGQALLGDPELVLLDEPTNGLDPELVARMRDLFRDQGGQRTLVISSHILAELEATCDHVIFMAAGRCTRSGPMAEITDRGTRLLYTLQGDAPLEALTAALPTGELRLRKTTLEVLAPPGWTSAQVNARLLPVLLQARVGILQVRQGRSLEDAYLEEHP